MTAATFRHRYAEQGDADAALAQALMESDLRASIRAEVQAEREAERRAAGGGAAARVGLEKLGTWLRTRGGAPHPRPHPPRRRRLLLRRTRQQGRSSSSSSSSSRCTRHCLTTRSQPCSPRSPPQPLTVTPRCCRPRRRRASTLGQRTSAKHT